VAQKALWKKYFLAPRVLKRTMKVVRNGVVIKEADDIC
jgi:hypothetical protein